MVHTVTYAPGPTTRATESTLITHPKFSLSDARPILDKTAHEPDLVVDWDGAAWVVWSARGRNGETIRLRRVDGESDGEGMVLSGAPGIVLQPTGACLGDGRLLVVWTQRIDDVWQIRWCEVEAGRASSPESVVGAPEGLFHPRLIPTRDSGCRLVTECIRDQQSSLVQYVFDGSRWRHQSLETAQGDCFRPCLTEGIHQTKGQWVSYDCYREGSYDVYLQRIDVPSKPIAVTADGFQNLQSDVAGDVDGNLWVAYSTNANDRGDPWWLTKYVTLLRFDGDSFSEPAEPMPDRDLYNEDSWQGWEFPSVVVDAGGRVWMFGQASHTLYAQFCDADGWSERFDIAQRRWGSWKPRVRAVGKDPIYVAAMGLEGAQIQELKVPSSKFQVPRSVPRSEFQVPRRAPRSKANFSLPTSDFPLFFGDLHAHSIYGDAVGDVDELYFRYRDAYGYDFATLTEHDFLDGIELSRSELAMMWAHADRMTVPGRFVALYGYEWTSPALADHAGDHGAVGEGHRHILYPDQTGPLVSYGEDSANTGSKLLQRLAGVKALVIQHHTGWSGTDWDAHDPRLSRLIEICSTHGRFEFENNKPIGYRRDHVHPGKFVLDGLARGLKLGFTGGSDSHGLRWHATEMEGRSKEVPAGTRVGWKEDAYRTGMTAIYAAELTREALFDALYDRRCYATSGVPIALEFSVDGSPMGSEVEVTSSPRISARVIGTAELELVQLVRSGRAFFSRSFGDSIRSHDAHVEMIDDVIRPGEAHFYYVRVVQRDGNMAWSSPVWVTWKAESD